MRERERQRKVGKGDEERLAREDEMKDDGLSIPNHQNNSPKYRTISFRQKYRDTDFCCDDGTFPQVQFLNFLGEFGFFYISRDT